MLQEAKTSTGTNYVAPNGKTYNLKTDPKTGKTSFISKADGSTKVFNSFDEAADAIIKGNPKSGPAIITQTADKKKNITPYADFSE